MGIYKTLFRIWLRFFWSKLRKCITTWIKNCAQCNGYNVQRSRQSELHFSWPVTAPFFIMHCNIWLPGGLLISDNDKLAVFNLMCDLTQFVVSCEVLNMNSHSLSKRFMEDVILSFGMVTVVVVDANSKFCSVFEAMCTALKIHFWPLARNNHKGFSIERFHRFLNKTQTICSETRGTQLTVRENIKTSQYA